MNSIFDFREIIEEELKKAADNFPAEGTLKEAMSYSLLAGGKRIRPLLALSSWKLTGRDMEEIYPLAVCLEMIHTYSLIHDDLPAMDNDDLRRGKPTSHKVFGEAGAILAGDALLNEAFTHFLKNYGDPVKYPSAMSSLLEISGKAGSEGMILGQMMDMEGEGKAMSEEYLNFMHSKKTGALITASLTAPAILGGLGDEKINILNDLGSLLGLLFQIEDDILDFTATAEDLGKSPGKDKREDKTTYVTLLGLAKSRIISENIYRKALETADLLGPEGNYLTEITRSLYSRKK